MENLAENFFCCTAFLLTCSCSHASCPNINEDCKNLKKKKMHLRLSTAIWLQTLSGYKYWYHDEHIISTISNWPFKTANPFCTLSYSLVQYFIVCMFFICRFFSFIFNSVLIKEKEREIWTNSSKNYKTIQNGQYCTTA